MSTSAPHRLALPVILTAQFVTPLSIAGVAVGLPSISADLGTQPTRLQWAVNGFNVAFALFTLVWGVVGDRLGHARTFTLGVAICLVASLGSTASPSLLALDGARILAGIGAAAVITSATAMLSQAYSGRQRAAAFAAFGTVNGLGLAAGPSVSGALLAVADWRAVFVAHAAMLALALLGCHLLPHVGSADPAKGATPRTSGRALLHPGYLAMVLVPVAGAAGFVTLLTYLPSALQAVRGVGAGTAGLMMLPMTLPVLVAPALVHRLTAHRSPSAQAIVAGLALACLAIAPTALLTFDTDSSLVLLLVVLVLAGLGFGLPLGLVDARALSFVPVDRQGAAAGVLNLFRIGSEAIFVAVYAAALTAMVRRQPGTGGHVEEIAAGQPGHAHAYAAAMHPVLAGLAVTCLVLLLAFVALERRSARETREGAALPSPGAEAEAATAAS